jgi:hypothetical protein
MEHSDTRFAGQQIGLYVNMTLLCEPVQITPVSYVNTPVDGANGLLEKQHHESD